MAIKINNLIQRYDNTFAGYNVINNADSQYAQKWFNILYNIMNLYDWTEKSKIVRVNINTGSTIETLYTKNQVKPNLDLSNVQAVEVQGYFNITDSIVLQIKCRSSSSNNNYSYLDASILTYDENRNYTKKLADIWYYDDNTYHSYFDICFDTTNKGVAIKLDAKYNTNSTKALDNLLMFNAFIGECTTITGEKRKGIITFSENDYLNYNKNTITVISGDDNVSVDTYQFVSNYNTNRKAVFIPIVNRLNGDIFKDIYMMRYTPIQHNSLEMNDNKQFICGTSVCLAD